MFLERELGVRCFQRAALRSKQGALNIYDFALDFCGGRWSNSALDMSVAALRLPIIACTAVMSICTLLMANI